MDIQKKLKLIIFLLSSAIISGGCGAPPLTDEYQKATIDSDKKYVNSQLEGQVEFDEDGNVESIEGLQNNTLLDRLKEGDQSEDEYFDHLNKYRNSDQTVFEYSEPEGLDADFSPPRMITGASLTRSSFQLTKTSIPFLEYESSCRAEDFSSSYPTIKELFDEVNQKGSCGSLEIDYCIRVKSDRSDTSDPVYSYLKTPIFQLDIPCPERTFRKVELTINKDTGYVSSDKVNLHIKPGKLVKSYALSNKSCDDVGSWENISEKIKLENHPISFHGNPPRAKVYAKFLDIFGKVSHCFRTKVEYRVKDSGSENTSAEVKSLDDYSLEECSALSSENYLWFDSSCTNLSELSKHQCSSLSAESYVWLKNKGKCTSIDQLTQNRCEGLDAYWWNESSCKLRKIVRSEGILAKAFGINGRVTHGEAAGGSGNDSVRAMSLQSDGSVLLAGRSENSDGRFDAVIWKITPNGNLDTNFDGDGVWVRSGENASSEKNNYLNCIAIQPDGKIIAAGGGSGSQASANPMDLAVYRLNPNGSLDTHFNGTGIVSQNFGLGGNKNDEALHCLIQDDGKILLGGYANNSSNQEQFAMWRYRKNGNLDTSFDSDGFLHKTSFSSDSSRVEHFLIQSDGKILVTGTKSNGTNRDMFLSRLNSDGSHDLSFASSTNGIFLFDSGNGDDAGLQVALSHDGHYLISGSVKSGAAVDVGAVWKIDHDGEALVNTFGTSGIRTFTSYELVGSENIETSLKGMFVSNEDGWILLSGTTGNSAGVKVGITIRLNANGTTDTSFANGSGWLSDDAGTPSQNTQLGVMVVNTEKGLIYQAHKTKNSSNTDLYMTKIK